jgi:hypothetical protein
MNRRVARFTNPLRSANALRVLLREAARRIDRLTDMIHLADREIELQLNLPAGF